MLSAVLLAAGTQGFLEAFLQEIRSSLAGSAEHNVTRLPADAHRWSDEMLEIRDTFEQLGLPGGFHGAAADIMRILTDSSFGRETRQTRDKSRSMEQTIESLVEQLSER